jgi:YihY family inner membrane protein
MINLLSNRARLGLILRETFTLMGRSSMSQNSAAFAYYALFAIFPFLALIVSVGSWFFEPTEVESTLRDFLPAGAGEQALIAEGVRALQSAHSGVNTAFLFVFLWAGARFFQSLVHGVNLAWHTEPLPWWQLPLKNLAMVLAVLVGAMFGVLIPLIMQFLQGLLLAFEEELHRYFPELHFTPYFQWISLLRFLLGFLFIFYAISVLYLLAPRRRVSFGQIWPAALLVTLLLQVGQNLFVTLVPRFIHYNAIYGTVGSLMFLLMWIYLSGLCILSGACLAAAWHQVTSAENTARQNEPSVR